MSNFRVNKSKFRDTKSNFRDTMSNFRVNKSKFRDTKSNFRDTMSNFRVNKSKFRDTLQNKKKYVPGPNTLPYSTVADYHLISSVICMWTWLKLPQLNQLSDVTGTHTFVQRYTIIIGLIDVFNVQGFAIEYRQLLYKLN